MLRSLAVAALVALNALAASPAQSEERVTLGYGRLFSNDYIGDGHDRWRSGAYNWSAIRGPEWLGERPGRLGEILEYRLRAEILAPQRVNSRGVDRPYVGRLSFGLHSHASWGATDVSLGADIVAVGPQTGVIAMQEWYHDTFGYSGPHGTENEIGNAVRLAGVAELAWPVAVSERLLLRPFVEAQGGVEDTLRIGADVIFGRVGRADLLIRDQGTGHLIRAVEGPAGGFALVAGADWTQVASSLYLPEDQGYEAEDQVLRARLGVHMQLGPEISFFYGLTRISEEFVGQREAQLLGSLKLNFNF